jgi:hypothetical protein
MGGPINGYILTSKSAQQNLHDQISACVGEVEILLQDNVDVPNHSNVLKYHSFPHLVIKNFI